MGGRNACGVTVRSPSRGDSEPPESDPPTLSPTERDNLRTLVAFHVSLRCGWIFKVETVIMPAVLDALSGAGWVRGCLPILNKLGQSVAPLAFSGAITRASRKGRALTATTGAMAAIFGTLAFAWPYRGQLPPAAAVVGFLGLYTIFFAATGTNVVAFNTVQGKLIPARRRGRLLWLSGAIGSVAAIALAFTLMPRWLAEPNGDGFGRFFIAAAVGFSLACVLTWRLREEPSPAAQATPAISGAQEAIRDPAIRTAASVGALAISGQLLFPHYQWIGQNLLGFGRASLLVWLLTQTAAVAVYAPISGAVCDRVGTRRAVQLMTGLSLAPPLMTVGFVLEWLPAAAFPLLFATLGLAPVLQKTILNHVLELAPSARHPVTLAAMQIVLVAPFVFAPAAGLLVPADASPAAASRGVLALATLCATSIACGLLASSRLIEPRDRKPNEQL